MKIKFKKLNNMAEIPTYAHPTDAGADLFATSVEFSEQYIEYGTGLAIKLPKDHAGLLFPRSSVSKKSLTLCNSVGIIDENYVGEIKLRFKVAGLKTDVFDRKIYEVGEKIGQLIVLPVPKLEFEEVDELDKTDRGDGSFGSSGK